MSRVTTAIVPAALLAAIITNFAACDFAGGPNEPVANFEYLWQRFDSNYGLFDYKNVDWDALHDVYRPRVHSRLSDDSLLLVMVDLLGHLNDGHVTLSTDGSTFQSGINSRRRRNDFSLSLVRDEYLRSGTTRTALKEMFLYGWLNDSVGYLYIERMRHVHRSPDTLDAILAQFTSASALVVDVRNNNGGTANVVQELIGRFADRRRLFLIDRVRNGPGPVDFSEPQYWHLRPKGPRQFTRPIILLTNRFSASGAEWFTAALRTLPQVRIVGDVTAGAMGEVIEDTLPNGWRVGITRGYVTDHRGRCWEGVGIPPDFYQTSTKSDIDDGRDRPLDLALDLLATGNLKPRVDSASIKGVRQSFVDVVAALRATLPMEQAIAAFERQHDSLPELFVVNELAINSFGYQLLYDEEDVDGALLVFGYNKGRFPESWNVYDSYAEACSVRGDTNAAIENYRRALDLNPRQAAWEKEGYRNGRRQLEKLGVVF